MKVINSVLFYRGGEFSVGAITFDLLLEEHHELKSTVTTHPVEEGAPISDHIIKELRSGSIKALTSNHSLRTATTLADGAPELAKLVGPNVRRYIPAAVSLAAAVASTSTSVGADASWQARVATAVSVGAGIQAAHIAALQPTPERLIPGLLSLPVPENRARNVWELLKQLQDKRETVTIVTGLEKYDNVAVTNVQTGRTPDTGEALEFDLQFTEIRRAKPRSTTVSSKVSPKLTTKAGQQASPNVDAKKTVGTGKTTKKATAALTSKVEKSGNS